MLCVFGFGLVIVVWKELAWGERKKARVRCWDLEDNIKFC